MAASMVGRPLSCDESTYNCIRLDYARVCVEVDASLPYVHEFEIESPLTSEPITVKVDYEWKPPRCAKCMIFGHSCSITPALHKGKQPTTDTNLMPSSILPTIKPTDPSTSTQHPLIEIPIPTTTPTLHIPNSTTNLPPENAEVEVAPLPPIPLPTLPVPISLPNPNTNPNSDDNQSLDEGSTGNPPHLQSFLDTNTCLEASTAETSTTSIPLSESHIVSPNPSPKTGRKKKGGRKRREAKGFQWL